MPVTGNVDHDRAAQTARTRSTRPKLTAAERRERDEQLRAFELERRDDALLVEGGYWRQRKPSLDELDAEAAERPEEDR